MAETRIFVNSTLFDRWMTAGLAELDGERLRAQGTGATYTIEEAVHVVAEVTGAVDTWGLLDRVRPVAELQPLGAEIMDRSMVIGDLAYDVIPGFLLSPVAPAGTASHLPEGGRRVASHQVLSALSSLSDPEPRIRADGDRESDEQLLARYLIEKL